MISTAVVGRAKVAHQTWRLAWGGCWIEHLQTWHCEQLNMQISLNCSMRVVSMAVREVSETLLTQTHMLLVELHITSLNKLSFCFNFAKVLEPEYHSTSMDQDLQKLFMAERYDCNCLEAWFIWLIMYSLTL